MSKLAARYSRVLRNCLDMPISDDGRYVYAWLLQSPSRDVIPGLCRLGPAGLAEEMGWTVRKVRRCLDELGPTRVVVDEAARVIFTGVRRHRESRMSRAFRAAEILQPALRADRVGRRSSSRSRGAMVVGRGARHLVAWMALRLGDGELLRTATLAPVDPRARMEGQ